MAFSWPGNIRQLENVIEHGAILCDDAQLQIPTELLKEKPVVVDTPGGLDATLRASEQAVIERALEQAEGRVSGPCGAALRLGVPASTLESKIKRLGIDKLRFRLASSEGTV